MAQTIEVGNFYMALLGNYHVAATKINFSLTKKITLLNCFYEFFTLVLLKIIALLKNIAFGGKNDKTSCNWP